MELYQGGIIFLLVLLLAGCVDGQVTAGQPENPIIDGQWCIRTFHSGGDVGCRGVVSAPLFPIVNDEQYNDFLALPANHKKSLVLALQYFNQTTLNALQSKGNVGAVILLSENGTQYSPASVSPQGKGSPDEALNPFSNKAYAWNPHGLGVLDQQYGFPILVANGNNSKVMSYANLNLENNAATDVKYTADIDAYFGPEQMTSIKCMNYRNVFGNRDPRCDPIGGQSAWAHLGNLKTSTNVVMAMASMDARATANYLASGANSAVSSLVALLAAADALKDVNRSSLTHSIVFAAFQGERYGFVGSRKFISDIKARGRCDNLVLGNANPLKRDVCLDPIKMSLEYANLNLKQVKYAMALDQVGIARSRTMYVHTNPNIMDTTIADLVTSQRVGSTSFKAGSANSIPPSPLLSFIKEVSGLNGAVIAGYDKEFTDMSYLGDNDVAANLNATLVGAAAQVLAQTLYNLSTDGTGSSFNIAVNSTLVDVMIKCLTKNWTCDLMNQYNSYYINSQTNYTNDSYGALIMNPINLYTSVYRQPFFSDGSKIFTRYNGSWTSSSYLQVNPTAVEMFTRSFLAAVTGSPVSGQKCKLTQDCGSSQECVYPGVCKAATSFFHDAVSPGLNATAKPMIFDVIDESMPLWAEPKWDSLSVFMWPDGGKTIGWVSLIIGIAVLGLSVVVANLFLGRFRKHKLL